MNRYIEQALREIREERRKDWLFTVATIQAITEKIDLERATGAKEAK